MERVNKSEIPITKFQFEKEYYLLDENKVRRCRIISIEKRERYLIYNWNYEKIEYVHYTIDIFDYPANKRIKEYNEYDLKHILFETKEELVNSL